MKTLQKSVRWQDGILYLLDQVQLPQVESILECHDIETVFEAIRELRVRGAPAIGVAAAYGLIVGLKNSVPVSLLRERADYLISARPTAVNLPWAINRMMALVNGEALTEVPVSLLEAEAIQIHREDIDACYAIGRFGLPLVLEHPNLLTHCNAGALAVSELGTALAPVYLAREQTENLHVFVDETRPLLQGARLTAYELTRQGVANTLISDNMAAYVMSLGKVDAVIVGADRVAANGDVANKIGTLNLAVLCHHYKLPFYVACPISTIDLDTESGKHIEVEIRRKEEITHLNNQQISLENVQVFNPAFDITPASLITAIITNLGVVTSPSRESLEALVKMLEKSHD